MPRPPREGFQERLPNIAAAKVTRKPCWGCWSSQSLAAPQQGFSAWQRPVLTPAQANHGCPRREAESGAAWSIVGGLQHLFGTQVQDQFVAETSGP